MVTPISTTQHDDLLRLSANFIHVDPHEAILIGDVAFAKGALQFSTDSLLIDKLTQMALTEGPVELQEPEFQATAQSAEISLSSDAVLLDSVQYRLPLGHGQGRAAQVSRDADGVLTLTEASYSTCLADEESWVLEAEQLIFDSNAQQGRARNARLKFKGIPLLYTPWFGFPLGDQRQSGFLPPTLGSTSASGSELQVPYYWNIAAHADMTIAPRYLSKRGAQLQNEFRYLASHGLWTLESEYLDDRHLDDDRYFLRLTQAGQLGNHWSSQIDASRTSDNEYFEDLGTSFSVSSTTHLSSSFNLRYAHEPLNFSLAASRYQTLDADIMPADRPYNREAQLTLNYRPLSAWAGLEFGLSSELVNFERDASVTGWRIDLNPRLSFPMGDAGWFVVPTLSPRYTRYDIQDPDNVLPNRPQRSLTTSSLDAGLVFERRLTDGARQTLEPRLYYLHTPFKDQTDLPNFDAGEFDFDFAQLFRNNRFSGIDRIGDADQLTIALTSRWYSADSRRETLRASLGQIQYFKDRQVVLPSGDGAAHDNRSALVADLEYRPDDIWSGRIAAQWNPVTEQTERSSFRLRWRQNNQQIFNVSYRFRDTEPQEQVDLSFRLGLSTHWNLVAKQSYSLTDSIELEQLAGVEYESCCWRFQVVAREFLNDDGNDTNSAVLFELVFKGFSSLGDKVDQLLEDSILGFRADEE